MRKNGRIPGIIYGKEKENLMFSLDQKEFLSEYNKGNIRSKLITIQFEQEKVYTVVADVQSHPVTDLPLHLDMKFVDKNAKINIQLPVQFVGHEKSPGIKKGGVLNILHRLINCNVLAANIPDAITVALTTAEIGSSINLKDVTLPEGISLKDKNIVIARITGRDKSTDETPVEEASEQDNVEEENPPETPE